MPFEEIEIVNKVDSVANHRLSNLVEGIQVGVQTGADKILVIDENTVSDKKFERFIIKKFLKGEDVRRWIPIWKGYYLIYPYKMENEKVYLYSVDELKSKAPNVWDYLLDFKERLGKRWGVKKAFYELPTVRCPVWFEKEKIITPDISNKNNFAYDDTGLYFSKGTVYGILLNKEYKDKIYFILGLLNSKLLEFYFKHISPMHAGGYFRYNTQYLEQLPIKLPQTPEEKVIGKEIDQKVNQILKLKRQLSGLEEKIKQFPNSYFEDDWSFDKLMNRAKVHLSKSSYKISEKKIRTYPFKELKYPFREVSRIILATEEYIDFYSEEVASYVLEVLKTLNRATKRELLELKIPQQPHLKNLLSQYRKDKEQIAKNRKVAEELEKQIDDLVYKLYNITYPERRIIENYVKKYGD